MKYSLFVFSILVLNSISLVAQVGINNTNPTATLDVVGDVLLQGKLYLEEPGKYTSSPTSKLLMVDNVNGVVNKYDIATSSFGPLNYVRFVFNNTSDYGLDAGYDTKISATKYTVAVHGYSFTRNGDTNLTLRSTTNNTYVEGHQFYAYVDGNTNTWWLKAFVNNSRFYIGTNLTPVDLSLDLIVYRNNFITKIWDTPQTVNMGGNATATAPLPAGF